MRRDNNDAPEILGRLAAHSGEQLDEPTVPTWARPVGWIILAALVGTIIYVVLRANPL